MVATYSAIQLDALKEVGNIGGGNAATSLSMMVQSMVDMELTDVEVLPVEDCQKRFGITPENSVSAILNVHQDLDGILWFAMEKPDYTYLAEKIAGPGAGDDPSLIGELANIMGGNYLMALGQLLNLNLDISPPMLKPLSEVAKDGNETFKAQPTVFIKSSLKIQDKTLKCIINLILNSQSLEKLLTRLGL